MKLTAKSGGILLVSILLFTSSFSQVHQWAWMQGDTTINSVGQYGIPNVPSINNNPPARREAAYWKDHLGNFWLFGGFSPSGLLNDLWEYNISTKEWTFVEPNSTQRPNGREGMAHWVDGKGDLWLFGGYGYGGNSIGNLNDLWKFDSASHQWSWVKGSNVIDQFGIYGTMGVSHSLNTPGSRVQSVSWRDKDDNLWLFGGFGNASSATLEKLNDLWKYNIITNCWTWMKGDMIGNVPSVYGIRNTISYFNKPGARFWSCAWTDSSNNLWLFAGLGVGGIHNDLWKFDILLNNWVWVNGDSTYYSSTVYGVMGMPAITNKPGALAGNIGWTDKDGNLWFYGGRGYSSAGYGDLNALWSYNILSNVWTFMKGDDATYAPGIYGTQEIPAVANKPGSREGPVGWTDNVGNLWMFGGGGSLPNGGSVYTHSDLWKYTLHLLVPVTLFSFTGQLAGTNTNLTWSVEKENGVTCYEIERSLNRFEFYKVGRIKAMDLNKYSFTDDVVEVMENENIYYRLKVIDIDNKWTYSNVVKIHIPLRLNCNISPNPAGGYTELIFDKPIQGKLRVEITDMMGKIIIQNYDLISGTHLPIPLKNLLSGTYGIKIIYKETTWIKKLVIVK